MPVTCPYGAEIKPGLQTYVYGYEIATQIAEEIAEAPILGNLVDALDWVVFDLQWVADHGPFDYPVFNAVDFTSITTLAEKVKSYVDAWLWANFCQCAARPGG